MKIYPVFALLPLLLIGCAPKVPEALPPTTTPVATATTPKPSSTTATPVPATSATNSAEQVHSWKLNGAIGGNNGQKAWSATVYWQEYSAQSYTLQLFGPVGMGTLKLIGNGNAVTLVTSKGERLHAPTAEALFAQQTGWHLPVSNLHYWVRGVPVPGGGAKTQYNDRHQLVELQQQGWSIQYGNYTTVNGVNLPTQLFLSKPPLKIRMAINAWHVEQPH